jgi:urea transport system permease protein
MNLFHNVKAQWLTYFLVFVLIALVPLFVSDTFLLNQFSTYGVFGLLALAISLCWGFGGILNLGQGIPFGLGAYGMAMTMQMQSQDASNPIPPFMLNNSLDHLPMLWAPFKNTALGITLSLVVPTLFCFLFGGLMFRARVSGPFFAIMTLAMLSAFYTLIIDVQPYTNGVNGITPPNALQFAGIAIDPYSAGAYWTVLGLLFVATMLAKVMTLSRFGLVIQAVRGDPERVRFLGYSVAGYETAIYTISGFIAAIAGCCWVTLTQYASPAQFDTTFSLSMVIWAGVGGRQSLIGAILGAFIIQGAQSYLGDTFLNTWLLVLGGFFILVVRFLPKGLVSLVEILLARFPVQPRNRNGNGVAAHRLFPQAGE